MARSGQSRAEANRAIRQQALREQLAGKGLLQQAIEISEKLGDLNKELDANQISRLRAAGDLKMKLVAKYLGDVKSVELTGEDGGPVAIKIGWDED